MECIYTSKDPQWALYHIRRQGGQARLIDSLKEVEAPTPFDEPITYVITSKNYKAKDLPPWGTVWVCGDKKDSGTSYPDYGKEVLEGCLGILDRDLYRWLLTKYEDYPGALERLTLKLKVLAMVKRGVLLIEDVQSLVPTIVSTPFLWSYQKSIGKPNGLHLIYGANNSDLWKAYMVDGGLMRHLKAVLPQLVYSLSQMRDRVIKGDNLEDSAVLWHLETIEALNRCNSNQ